MKFKVGDIVAVINPRAGVAASTGDIGIVKSELSIVTNAFIVTPLWDSRERGIKTYISEFHLLLKELLLVKDISELEKVIYGIES